MRWVVTAVVMAVVLSACSGDDDPAGADPTPSATATTTASPSPTPTSSATPPAPTAVAFKLSGRGLRDRRVVAVKTFWTGATASAIKGAVVPQVRSSSTRGTQRALASEIKRASAKGWKLPAQPIGVVTGVSGKKGSGTVTVCMWSPSVSWISRKTGRHVEAVRKRWLRYQFTVADGKVSTFSQSGTCRRPAP